ncbi:hypothetical protein D4L85_15740 [Chryseolinea soli]|uniref:Uncharacterized protein n=1 Tax=Chryseolinea soli TaxID=2321403 RepID=A0A385SN52_9BACT|nr:hypothetical protein D4L85_15740 [Chryseolinea soli]
MAFFTLFPKNIEIQPISKIFYAILIPFSSLKFILRRGKCGANLEQSFKYFIVPVQIRGKFYV